VSEAS